jgi:hypothetical protein
MPLWIFKFWGFNLGVGIVFALIFSVLYQGIPGEGLKKGIVFGSAFWLIGFFPACLFSCVYISIPSYVFLLWSLFWLFVYIGMGLTVAFVFKKANYFT